jgi:putative ABC transport system permease protein
MEFYRLVWRNLLAHKLRTLLTIGSLVVAVFLLCTLRSLVTTLETNVATFSSKRLWVQSAVSLFVDFPQSYQPKIETVPGVVRTCKWQWFGGFYKDSSNFFGQFAVDQERLIATCPEVQLIEGSEQAFLAKRNACIVGEGLCRSFGWKLGDKVPIIGALFPHPDGADKAWEFEIAAIYKPGAPNWDNRTLFFRWDYFEEVLRDSPTGIPGVGVILVETVPGANQEQIIASIDAQFAGGPQRTQTTTEAEFNRQFATMFGNIPFFVSSIGGGVLLAIALACINTMLMAAREQTHDVGILKALGFSDGRTFGLMLAQSLSLCLIGGLLGLGLAKLVEPGAARALGVMFPGFRVLDRTLVQGLLLCLAIGVIAGLVPAWRARALKPVDALRTEI